MSERTCIVEGCEKRVHAKAMCAVHAARLRRTGTTDLVGRRKGPDNYRWAGDEVSYGAIHRRLRVYRGSASSHPCEGCEGEASHWAYDHLDVNQKESERGPYSASLDHYRPLCVPCHKTADLERLGKARQS